MKRLFPSLLFLTLASGCGFYDVDKGCTFGPGLKGDPILGTDLPENSIALTFSGGPSEHSEELADFLYGNNIKATFFASGAEAIEHRDELAHIRDRNHLIGNNSYSGKDLRDAPDPAFEVRKTDEIITPYITGNMFLLRAPENGFDEDMAELLNDEGLRKYVGPIQWDIGESQKTPPSGTQTIFRVDADCWANDIPPATCAQGYIEQIRVTERGIVLMHDTTEDTLELVKTLVPNLLLEGFTMVRIDEVPPVRLALEESGAKVGIIGGAGGCDDY